MRIGRTVAAGIMAGMGVATLASGVASAATPNSAVAPFEDGTCQTKVDGATGGAYCGGEGVLQDHRVKIECSDHSYHYGSYVRNDWSWATCPRPQNVIKIWVQTRW
jgi:hypothetical protein